MQPLRISAVVLLTLSIAACNLGDADYSSDDADGGDGSGIGLDKTVVVYETFTPSTGRSSLYAAASDGTVAHLLAPESLSSASIDDYEVSPAGVYVAYRIASTGAERPRLYIANAYTGDITEVTGRAGGPAGADEYAWSPSGAHLAYTGGSDPGLPGRLYIYDRAADRSRQLSPGESAEHDLAALDATPDLLEWSPNGAALAYRSHYGSDELNAIAPDGSDYRRMSGPLVAGGEILDVIEWAPDSSRIAYLAAQDVPDVPEAFATRFDGSGNVQLSPTFSTPRESSSLHWSPDSGYVAITVLGTTTAGAISLEGVAADGSHTWTIASNLSSSGAVDPLTVDWSADSSYIAYLADREGDGLWEVYSAAVPAADIHRLSDSGQSTSPETLLVWDPASNLLGFSHDAAVADKLELYTSDPTGATVTKISGTLPAEADVLDFAWSTQGHLLAYRVRHGTGINIHIFDTTANATTNVATASPAVALLEPEWLPRTEQLVFIADTDSTDVGELFVADADGTVRKISHRIDPTGPLTGEDVVSFELFP